MPLSTVTVTGTLLDAAQNPQNGQVTFTPVAGPSNPVITSITDAAGMVIIAMTGVTETLVRGSFSVALVPTDTTGLYPQGWLYRVTVQSPGLPAYSALYYIPSSPNPVDLSALVPVLPVSSTPQPWNLETAAGSDQRWIFALTIPGTNTPWPISGATWEYVLRATPTSTGTPLASFTTTATAAGLITVTSTSSLSQVLVDIYPAATASLAPGTYYQTLWMNPGTNTALAVAAGTLTVAGTPQP